ncbi:spore germination protein GerPE [Ornithinibacillus scapharcae]|uniref:spore germination protein GerPE n=1 Tax=Ornithinibacillus scapharcae TaxID=1147159 RepID=UPI000225B55C|nr:spore germination protein GerPE [Ornithinibacillus scapharcae]
MRNRMVQLSQSEINTIAFSSICNIGDSVHFNPKFKAIAVQREGNSWNENYDFHFSEYSLFQRQTHWVHLDLPVEMNSNHHNGIQVNSVSISDVSQSSLFQVGGLNKINAETRLKHFRILLDDSVGG